MDSFAQICCELLEESTVSNDTVVWECIMESGEWGSFKNSDKQMKRMIGICNSLINQKKTRWKGMQAFCCLLPQLDSKNVEVHSDSIKSSLLLLAKNLDAPIVYTVLEELIPICQTVPELNSILSTQIVPKIFSHLCEPEYFELTNEERRILEICLLQYPGAGGKFKAQLQTRVLSACDRLDENLVASAAKTLVHICSAGGGGPKGQKHSDEWSEVVKEIILEIYETLKQIGPDLFPISNMPAELQTTQRLKLPNLLILEDNFCHKISILSNRIVNLFSILSTFLDMGFKVPKVIPSTSIVDLVSIVVEINPHKKLRSAIESRRKEEVYFACIFSKFHRAALSLLKSLIACLKIHVSSVYPEILGIILETLKCFKHHNYLLRSMKLEYYKLLLELFSLPSFRTSDQAFIEGVVEMLLSDIKIDTNSQTVETGNPKLKKSISNKRLALAAFSFNHNSEFVEKSSLLCRHALAVLLAFKDSLDAKAFWLSISHLLKSAQTIQTSSTLPIQYDDDETRYDLYYCLYRLTKAPVTKVPLTSIGYAMNQGTKDASLRISNACAWYFDEVSELIHLRPVVSVSEMGLLSIPDLNNVGEESSQDVGNEDAETQTVEGVEIGSSTSGPNLEELSVVNQRNERNVDRSSSPEITASSWPVESEDIDISAAVCLKSKRHQIPKIVADYISKLIDPETLSALILGDGYNEEENSNCNEMFEEAHHSDFGKRKMEENHEEEEAIRPHKAVKLPEIISPSEVEPEAPQDNQLKEMLETFADIGADSEDGET